MASDAGRRMRSSRNEHASAVANQVRACCSSPAAICYWFIVSLLAWGVLSLSRKSRERARCGSSEATCLFAMAIGCFANWLRNRTFHCAITGPLFLIGGVTGKGIVQSEESYSPFENGERGGTAHAFGSHSRSGPTMDPSKWRYLWLWHCV